MRTPRALPALAGDPDQVPRLQAFRARYPQVMIGTLGVAGAWQARVPQPNGEIVVTRYVLRDLLDKLDEVLTGQERDGTSDAEAADDREGR